MARHRSLRLAVVTLVALLTAGTTFAWAGGIVGGHRADHIGTFEPISQRVTPAGATLGSNAASTTGTGAGHLSPTSATPDQSEATTADERGTAGARATTSTTFDDD